MPGSPSPQNAPFPHSGATLREAGRPCRHGIVGSEPRISPLTWAMDALTSLGSKLFNSLQKCFLINKMLLGKRKCSRTKFLVLHSSKMVQRPLGLSV